MFLEIGLTSEADAAATTYREIRKTISKKLATFQINMHFLFDLNGAAGERFLLRGFDLFLFKIFNFCFQFSRFGRFGLIIF